MLRNVSSRNIRFWEKKENFFGSPVTALALVCALSFFQQMLVNGLTTTVISTIERRFQLQSVELGLMVSLYDIFRAVGLVLLIIPNKLSKPLWLTISCFVLAIGTFLFSIPHFISPEYTYRLDTVVNYCNNVTTANCEESNARLYRFIFFLSMACIGIGSSLIVVHGITYIDENVTKAKSSKYSSIYFTMGAWGPALGYLSGGFSLNLFVNISKTGVQIDERNPHWVGAWWLMYVFTAGVFILLAIIMYQLPKRLNTNNLDRNRQNSEVYSSTRHTAAQGSFLQFLCNPTLFLSCIGHAVVVSFVLGFNTFGVKYAQSQFGLDAMLASFAFGGTAVIFFSLSTIMSGLILSKYKLDIRDMMKYVTFFGLISIALSCGFFIHCDGNKFAGGNYPYSDGTLNPGNLSSTCNENCGCSLDRYQPVIDGNNTLYFSPCHAGCMSVENNGVAYSNCSCIDDSINQTITTFTNKFNEKLCPIWTIALFFVVCGSNIFAAGSTITPMTQITLRCVEKKHKTRAMGLQQLLVVVFGTVPGRILTGKIIDISCLIWITKCNETGSCKLYDQWKMAQYITYFLIAQSAVITILNVIMFFTYKTAKTHPIGTVEENKQ